MRLRKQQRLVLVAVVLALVASAAALVLTALQDRIAFFVSPSELAEGGIAEGKLFRLGGLVVPDSVHRSANGDVRFAVSDKAHSVDVVYRGILPDLFREGQGIVAQGVLGGDGSFIASEVLAKHDERYMPPEVAEALKRSGHWQPPPPRETAPPREASVVGAEAPSHSGAGTP